MSDRRGFKHAAAPAKRSPRSETTATLNHQPTAADHRLLVAIAELLRHRVKDWRTKVNKVPENFFDGGEVPSRMPTCDTDQPR